MLLLNDPPVVAVARLEGVPATTGRLMQHLKQHIRGRWSGLAGRAALPPNVHLLTLMRADEGDGSRAIIRLAHVFQVRSAGVCELGPAQCTGLNGDTGLNADQLSALSWFNCGLDFNLEPEPWWFTRAGVVFHLPFCCVSS